MTLTAAATRLSPMSPSASGASESTSVPPQPSACGEDVEAFQLDIVEHSREWAGDPELADSDSPVQVHQRRRDRVATAAVRARHHAEPNVMALGLVKEVEDKLRENAEVFRSRLVFQAATGIWLFLSVNGSIVVLVYTIVLGATCGTDLDCSDLSSEHWYSWNTIFILPIIAVLDMLFIAFQVACAWRDRDLSQARRELWHSGSYLRWMIYAILTVLFLGVLSGWQLLRSYRQFRNPQYRDSFLADLSDPGFVDDAVSMMPMYSSHLTFIFEVPMLYIYSFWGFASPIYNVKLSVPYIGLAVSGAISTSIAAVAFDRAVSSRLERRRDVQWLHMTYRLCETICRCLVLSILHAGTASWVEFHLQPFVMATLAAIDIGLTGIALAVISRPLTWHNFAMIWVWGSSNLALFVDTPTLRKKARQLVTFFDVLWTLEVAAAACVNVELLAETTPESYSGAWDLHSWHRRLVFILAMLCGSYLTCASIRAFSCIFSHHAPEQGESTEPRGSNDKHLAHDDVYGLPRDLLYRESGHGDGNLAAHLFVKGIGDQLFSWLEIMIERKDTLKLSRLRMVRQLGEGGFGRVFEVKDTRNGTGYALKLQPKSSAATSAVREAKTLHKLKHSFIVNLVRVFHTEAFYCILMELCDMDLNRRILRCLNDAGLAVGLPTERAKRYAACITLALGHVHSLGFAFRDLKPENVLTTGEDGNVAKLADFGLARRCDSCQFMTGWSGTAAFMPPSCGAPTMLESRDWYAMGCCLALMLLGEQGGRLVHFEERAVLLPPRPEEVTDVLEREAHRLGDDAVELIGALMAEDAESRADIREVRSSPFLADAVAQAEMFIEAAASECAGKVKESLGDTSGEISDSDSTSCSASSTPSALPAVEIV